jgi:hypothetical protein
MCFITVQFWLVHCCAFSLKRESRLAVNVFCVASTATLLVGEKITVCLLSEIFLCYLYVNLYDLLIFQHFYVLFSVFC